MAVRAVTVACLILLSACDAVGGPAPGKAVTGYSIDALKMVDACKDGQPIYWSPNGAYWIWRGGWTRVAMHTGTDC